MIDEKVLIERLEKDNRIGRTSLFAFMEIINQLAEEHDNGWIACSERLPKEYTEVLGCDYEGNISVVELYKDNVFGKIWRQWNGGSLKLNVIIAWMPLPAPYMPKGE